MTREEKNTFIEDLSSKISESNIFYLSDISEIDAEETNKLRRLCHSKDVKLNIVKNTLLKKAFEKAEGDYEAFYDVLKGNTSIMFSEVANAPAKVIKEFRKKSERPVLKGAFVEQSIYIGDDQIEALSTLKSKEELLGDIILLLQSPTKNVISSLQSASGKLAGIVKNLSEREA